MSRSKLVVLYSFWLGDQSPKQTLLLLRDLKQVTTSWTFTKDRDSENQISEFNFLNRTPGKPTVDDTIPMWNGLPGSSWGKDQVEEAGFPMASGKFP